jgi:putative sterol carrier protein
VSTIDPNALDEEQLDEVVEGLDPDALDALLAGLNGEALSALVAKAKPETARKLIAKIDPGTFDLGMIDHAGIDPTVFDPDLVALVIRNTPDGKLAEAMGGELRDVIVPEVMRRMPERLNEEAAAAVEGSIEWTVTRDGGESDTWILVIDRGTSEVLTEIEGEPRVRLEVGPVDFLRVVTANANPVELFMSGKLKVVGDLMFGASIPSLFRLPNPDA